MRKIILGIIAVLLIGISSDLQAKPKITVDVTLTFGKKKSMDDEGNCPSKGICKLKISVGVDPKEAYNPNSHGIGVDDDGNLIIIVSKKVLEETQPDKYSDFENGSYSFDGDYDLIPANILNSLGLNADRALEVEGDFEVKDEGDVFIINLGKY